MGSNSEKQEGKSRGMSRHVFHSYPHPVIKIQISIPLNSLSFYIPNIFPPLVLSSIGML
jgi:hypothetical protein